MLSRDIMLQSFPSNISQIPVFPQPLHLWTGIPVDDVALVVLETPGDHDEDISFSYPDSLLDRSLYPAHTGYPVETFHPDMVGPHHELGLGKDLVVPLAGKAYPDDLFTRSTRNWLLVGQCTISLLPLFGTCRYS